MTKIRFNGSNCLSDKRVTIKNTGKAAVKASLFVKNILSKKKKKRLMIVFINIIIGRVEGGIRNDKVTTKTKIDNKKISFFPNLPVACIIDFNYNRKLWLK